MPNYFHMGENDHNNRKPRESCRFKSDHTRGPWLEGWDAAKVRSDARAAAEKVPRWDDDYKGQYSTTRGDCLRIELTISMYGTDGEHNTERHWFMSSRELGISVSIDLGTADIAEAKSRVVAVAREHLRKLAARLEALEANS